MKRPPGFDPTARPTDRTTPPGKPVPRTTVPRTTVPAQSDATTEPIQLPTADRRVSTNRDSTAGSDLPGLPGLPGLPDQTPARAPAALGGLLSRVKKPRRSVGAPGVSEAAEAPLTARAARARLRAARRARKQYERNEVRRFTTRSRRRRNLWITLIATVLALVAFVLVGVFSPLMALRSIEVTGTNRIQAAEVAEALDDQLGTPLPLLDLAEVKRQLSEFSLIRSFVTESRPPGTLVVRIVEREPVGTITSEAGFDLVDAAGVVIESGAERPAGYPLVLADGGTSGAGFQAAVAVVGALPENIRVQLDSVTAATKDDVTLTLVGGARVVWGNAERSEYKAVVLGAIVSNPVGSVTEYDVSSPDSAVVR